MNDDQESYDERVLDHYEDPFHRGTLDGATHSHEADNPLTGDRIRIELIIDSDGTIAEAWFEGDGSVISQASTSMLLEEIEGKTIDEVKAFRTDDMLRLFASDLPTNRQKCCLLGWRVLQSAIHSPTEENGEDGDYSEPGGPNFGGPSLREES